jgi:hypothetical protein
MTFIGHDCDPDKSGNRSRYVALLNGVPADVEKTEALVMEKRRRD